MYTNLVLFFNKETHVRHDYALWYLSCADIPKYIYHLPSHEKILLKEKNKGIMNHEWNRPKPWSENRRQLSKEVKHPYT